MKAATRTAVPTFNQIKKTFLDSGYEIRFLPSHELESLALDAPFEVKRHKSSNIMGLIMPDENIIGLAQELSTEERAATLLHEIIHLYDESMEEEDVEAFTLELEQTITPSQYGFIQFLVS